jgi:hypothetical protein
MDFDPTVWRDVVIVPPNGRTRIWVQYKNYTGKTVFHCHFLAHEDTGMMSTLFIGPQDYVFHWEDHIQTMIGIGVGILIASILSLCYIMTRGGKAASTSYEPVAMNELKSKAVD